jgi:hypothetical protein
MTLLEMVEPLIRDKANIKIKINTQYNYEIQLKTRTN